MKILFIKPKPSEETIGLQHLMLVEPLELEVLAALVPDKDKVRIIDLTLEKEGFIYHLHEFGPDILCITSYITNISEVIEYCQTTKIFDDKIITIVGGVHIEKFPDLVNDPAIDFRVVRNATRVFPKLLGHIKGQEPLPEGVLSYGQDITEIVLPDYDFYFPIPRRDLTAKYRQEYFYVFHDHVALMKTSFGCPYKCKFCFCRFITSNIYHERDLEDVIDELEKIDENEIFIIDDDFLVSSRRVQTFIEQLHARDIHKNYLIFGRADFIVKYPRLIEDFRDTGLKTIITGLESFNDDELLDFDKRSNSIINEKALQILYDLGIDCYAAIILSPDWDRKDFEQLTDRLIKLGIKYVNLQPLTPLPGTDVDISGGDLIIDPQDYAKWDLAHLSVRPTKLSESEYYNEILRAYRKIVFRTHNMSTFIRHSPRMQLRVLQGIRNVYKQYKKKHLESSIYA